MKIVITGHTRGLGKSIYEHFTNQGHEVIGLSSSNGFRLPGAIKEVTEIAQGCDIFFNNAYAGSAQITLLKELFLTTPMVISGSMGSDYAINGNQYFIDKFELEKAFKFFKKVRKHPLLMLKMGYLENYKDKPFIPYSQILKSIDFWIENPRATMIEFDNVL